jgi:hypothetical protein
MVKPLSHYFGVNRRYVRSINLERDLEVPEAVLGYVPTERAVDTLKRILISISERRAPRAWTLTGVYGTGKSAFAHYLASLFAPKTSSMRRHALAVAEKTFGADSAEYQAIATHLPKQGLLRAVATGQREPLSHTIIRALEQGTNTFWKGREQPGVAKELTDLAIEVLYDRTTVNARRVLELIRELAKTAKTDVIIIIDELGKNLEFAVQTADSEDLYLLQQLAELSQDKGSQIYLVGLLHQSFADYSQRLVSAERSEWAKIQGRFEDIPFTESAEQMTRLLGQTINQTDAESLAPVIRKRAIAWNNALQSAGAIQEDLTNVFATAYPLHPLTALVLPVLCTRYAQNDRSLFTFLTSAEPHSFQSFLQEFEVEEEDIPTLQLYQIYDYFVEAIGTNLSSRPNLQRWTEIQGLIADAKQLDSDSLQVLKTIGILNLITTTGCLRATPALVTLALVDNASDRSEKRHWQKVIQALIKRGLVTHRKQLDELRLWEGSDIDVEAEIDALIEKEQLPLAKLLAEVSPLKPLVAQRHSYRTGTLRYFERQYLDASHNLNSISSIDKDCGGLIGYWVGGGDPSSIPTQTSDGKPLILLNASGLEVLKARTLEFSALKKLCTAAQILKDGVARREVHYRLLQAEQLLDEAIAQSFSLTEGQHKCWIEGQAIAIAHVKEFHSKLSEVCDRVYYNGPILWNELINRRELTSQGAKARRELLEAMLAHPDQERLGLEGNGPEVSMYASLLGNTGIHRQEQGVWGFYPPSKPGLQTVWEAIAQFCVDAKDQIQGIDRLYALLEAPPYGVKRGAIPVILGAVLLHHADDVSLYKDGTFIPSVGPEHFELLVKDPALFAVKYVGFIGLRAQIFQELEKVLRGSSHKTMTGGRNRTLLSVVKPLFQFVKKLPVYTTKTQGLSKEAKAVLQAILQAQEPDKLLFVALPQACGLSSILAADKENEKLAKAFCQKLVQALRELQGAYDRLLTDCQSLLHQTFAVSSDPAKLREELRVRSRSLVGQCVDPLLRRFTLAAVEEDRSDREWLEALLMIVADKPAESWSDEDTTRFEARLSELARKFLNVEALRSEVNARSKEGFEVRRITVTRPDGQEINRVVWTDRRQEALLDNLVADILARADLKSNPQLQQALVARLTEEVLNEESEEILKTAKSSKSHMLSTS